MVVDSIPRVGGRLMGHASVHVLRARVVGLSHRWRDHVPNRLGAWHRRLVWVVVT
jgi:hypothetical protein